MTDIQTQAIILSYEDYKEVDRIITVYARDLGKLKAIARGARKIKAKLSGHLEIFNLCELQLVFKRSRIGLIISAINIKNYQKIKSDVKKLAAAFAVAELIDKTTTGEEKDEKIFNLIAATLDLLEISEKNHTSIYYFFVFNLMDYLGYKPELKNCVVCRKELFPGQVFFSFENGGTVCGQCHKKTPEKEKVKTKKIQDNTLKVIRLFFSDKKIISKLNFDKTVLKEMEIISKGYLQFNLGIEIRSLSQ